MTSSPLLERLDRLIGFFNRRGMDVPEGLFARDAQFTLNGAAFETLLGRSEDDPLIRMIARGAAGYRFAAKPLLHALETALVSRMSATGGAARVRVLLALRGTLRGSGAVLDEMVSVDISLAPDGAVVRADVMISEAALDKIRTARTS